MLKCMHPIKAWRCGQRYNKDTFTLVQNIVFSEAEAMKYFASRGLFVATAMLENELTYPCGKCASCLIRKRKDMSVRLSKERECYRDDVCFITLTYDDEKIPVTDFNTIDSDRKLVDRGLGELPLLTLLPSDVQKFMKRLRRHLEYVPKKEKKRIGRDHVSRPIRYFAVGEYGGKTGRPHYHIIIYGWKPSDLTFHMKRKDYVIYRSAQIEKLWKFGFSTVAPVTPQVCAYCARYVTKKFVTDKKDFTGGFSDCVFPTFCLQSVKEGGIGAKWFDSNIDACLSKGYVDLRLGDYKWIKAKIPDYFLRRAKILRPMQWFDLVDEKINFIKSHDRAYDFNAILRSVADFELQEERLSQYEIF